MLSKHMATKYAHDLYELASDKNLLAEANFLLQLAEKHRDADLPAILREYVELAKENKSNLIMADVTTALPLTASQEQALAEKLAAICMHSLELNFDFENFLSVSTRAAVFCFSKKIPVFSSIT